MIGQIDKKPVHAAMIHLVCCALFIISCILFTTLSTTLAQEEARTYQESLDAIDEELRWLEAETYVITPSKIPEKIKETAASITVVTDRQIRQMGAKHLDDVIERIVPSFSSYHHVSSDILYVRKPLSRVLFMINGLPLYDPDLQGAIYNTHINLGNVKRIEFIRSPGSALYGANAYHGVINIITKKAGDVDGAELTARGGSWDTQQYNLLFGKAFGELETTFNFNYFKTHGHSALIKKDVATWYDKNVYVPLGYPPISLTPGHTKEYEEKYELALNVKYKGFIFDGGYIESEHNYPLTDGYYSLTEKNTFSPENYYLNLCYETSLEEKLNISTKAYRYFQKYIWDSQVRAPGYVDIWNPASFGTTWPEGVFHILKEKNSRTGMELQVTYKMSDVNTFVAGATYEKQKIFDNELWANYRVLPDSGGNIRLPSIQRISSNHGIDFEYEAFFIEDVWGITQDLRLTLGARYDDYSTFGGHFSPRVGLTWESSQGSDINLLYGHAFAVPSATQTVQRIPGTILDPQRIDSYEASFGAEFTSSFEGRITFFHNDEKDFITYVPRSAPNSSEPFGWTNLGGDKTQGVDIEMRYDLGRGTYISANYSYSRIDGDDDSTRYYGKIMSNIRLSRYLNLCVDGYYFNGLDAEAWDLSGVESGWTIVNASLIARKFLKGHEGLEFQGSVYNLFDEDYATSVDQSVPYGWPQPGINFLIEARYKF